MIRLFATALVVAALLSTSALANRFSINEGVDEGSANISSGLTGVSGCTGNVTVDIVGAPWSNQHNDYPVRFIDVDITPACAWSNVQVDLLDGNGASMFHWSGVFVGPHGTRRIVIPASTTPRPLVGNVHSVAVMIDAP